MDTLSINKLFHEISYNRFTLSHIIKYTQLFEFIEKLDFNIITKRFDNNNLFIQSAIHGCLSLLKYISNKNLVSYIKQDINYYIYDIALIWAAENCNLEIVQFLLNNGANVHVCNDFPLYLAMKHSNNLLYPQNRNKCYKIAQFLIKNGSNSYNIYGHSTICDRLYGFIFERSDDTTLYFYNKYTFSNGL